MIYVEDIVVINLFSDLLSWLIVGILFSLYSFNSAIRQRKPLFLFLVLLTQTQRYFDGGDDIIATGA
jgi:hypothetical protein